MAEETQPNRLGTLFSGASVKKPATRARTFLFPDSPAEVVKQNTGTQSGKDHNQPNFFNQGSLPAVVTDNLKVQSLGTQNTQKFPVDVIPQSNPRRRNVLGKTMSGFLNTNTGAGLSSTFVFPYSSQPFQPIQISGHTRVNSLGSSRGFLNPLKTLDSKVGVSVPPNHLSEFKRLDKDPSFRMNGVEILDLDATVAFSDHDASHLPRSSTKNKGYLQISELGLHKDELIGSNSISQIRNSVFPSLHGGSPSTSTIQPGDRREHKSESKSRYQLVSLSQEERVVALQPISKLREQIAQPNKGIGQLVKKFSGQFYMTAMNFNFQTKTSQSTFLSELAVSVADFGKGLLDVEEGLRKKITVGKANSELVLENLPKKTAVDNGLLDSLAQELTKTQNIVSGMMSQDAELKIAKEENKRLKETIANFDKILEDRVRKIQQEHDLEVGRIKNSFYVVHKLHETITSLERQLTSQEVLANSKSSKIQALESQILSQELKLNRQREHIQMMREDLSSRTTQALYLKQELSQMKQGIMGIMFNREQRANRAVGEQSSVMERKEIVRDFVRQYEEETKKSTVCLYLVKNESYEGEGTWSLADLGQKIWKRGGGQYWGTNADDMEQSSGSKSARGELFENLVLKSMKLARSDVSFAEFHLAGPTFASLVQYELMELSLKEIEELFTKKFEILVVVETIRAIFDSYYVEILSHEKLDTCPWFGEFVYMWFERFEIDPFSKKLIATTQDSKMNRRRRAEFSILMASPIFQKVWDGFTFTEFLSGRYQKDEILYFLNCRYSILMGLQQDTRGIAFDIYSYVPENHVQQFLDQMRIQLRVDRKEDFLLQNLFDSMPRIKKTTMQRPRANSGTKERNLLELAKMNADIVNQSQDKANQPDGSEPFSFVSKEIVTNYVDLYQVLRLMLEEYRACKVSKYLSLFELVKEGISRATRNERLLEFSTLHTLLQKMYPGIASSLIMATYRLGISLGRGKLSIESLYCAGENSGVYALTERFSVLSKYEFINRIDCIRKGNIAFNEIQFNKEPEALKAEAEKYGKSPQLPRSDLDFLQSYLEKAIQDQPSEKVLEQRIKISKWANTLGSINLVEQYEQVIIGLSEAHPKSINYVCSPSLYLGRVKHLETKVLELRGALLSNLHGGYLQEFNHILDLVGVNPHFERVVQLEKRRSKQIQHRNSKGRQLKAAFVRQLAEWYKMYVNLLTFKTASKPQPEASAISKKSQISMKKRTTTQAGEHPRRDTNLLEVVSSASKIRKSSANIQPNT